MGERLLRFVGSMSLWEERANVAKLWPDPRGDSALLVTAGGFDERMSLDAPSYFVVGESWTTLKFPWRPCAASSMKGLTGCSVKSPPGPFYFNFLD